MELPTSKERRTWAIQRSADWKEIVWSGVAGTVGLLVSLLALADTPSKLLQAAAITVGSVVLTALLRFAVNYWSASGAILVDRGTGAERERDQYKAVVALVAKGQNSAYTALMDMLGVATELTLRNLPQIQNTSGEMIADQAAKASWIQEVMRFRERAAVELRPHIMPHDWDKIFGFTTLPQNAHYTHEVDPEHAGHVRFLAKQIAVMQQLTEVYATRPKPA